MRKRNRGVRTREGHARPIDGGSPDQPLAEVLNETRRRKPKKTWAALIPVSDDPLEEVSLSCIDIEEYSAKHISQNIVEQVPMPDSYVLVPKGDVYITRHCRSKTKESERIVYVVYVNPHPNHQFQVKKRTANSPRTARGKEPWESECRKKSTQKFSSQPPQPKKHAPVLCKCAMPRISPSRENY